WALSWCLSTRRILDHGRFINYAALPPPECTHGEEAPRALRRRHPSSWSSLPCPLCAGAVGCLPPAGPAEIDACGADATTKRPTNVSDGHRRSLLSGSRCSAQESPRLKPWRVVN